MILSKRLEFVIFSRGYYENIRLYTKTSILTVSTREKAI